MEAEVVVLLHARQNLEVAAEVSLPVMDRDELLAILSLRFVDFGTIVDNCLQVCEAGDIMAPESLLQQTKAPVGGKLCVPCNKKVEGDGPVLAVQHSPGTVPQHVAIVVLPRAVVTVQACISLSQAIPCEEEVEERNDCIRPLRHKVGLVDEEVDLFWYGFAAHTKQATLPWYKKVQRSRLHGVAGQVHLLSIVEAIVHYHASTTGFVCTQLV